MRTHPVRWFPVRMTGEECRLRHGPTTGYVEWGWLALHRVQAMKNHGGQTLDALASTGGLRPDEILAIVNDREWRSMPLDEAWDEILRRHDEWRAAHFSRSHDEPAGVNMTELDVDGIIDEKGIRYIGLATKRPTGQWVCLADVEGCLCLVEVKIRPSRR